jgi:hypothetical protein
MSHDRESPPSQRVPLSTGRLFPGLTPAVLGRSENEAFVIGRLLEEGDTQDLRWLVRTVGEEALERWLASRGERQLSRRSRAFWSLVLTGETMRGADDPLWPL